MAENLYVPDRASLPGETLLEVLEDRQLSQAELADRMGRPKKTINEIINGKSAITPDTALQLERVLGVPAGFWNNLEQNYQDSVARHRDAEQLANWLEWHKRFPLKEMLNLRWLHDKPNPVEQVAELLRFFGVASPADWERVFAQPQASFRHARTFESDVAALSVWLRRGEIEARAMRCERFDRAKFQAVLSEARHLTVLAPDAFVFRLKQICASAGVAVAFVPELKGCRACGATQWVSSTRALIQLSLRYKTNDHLWFTFFHEAGHILLHGKKLVFLEADRAGTVREEEQANQFAADHLIPRTTLSELRRMKKTTENVVSFAQRLGIAPGIVVGRLQHEGLLPRTHLNGLKMSLAWVSQAAP